VYVQSGHWDDERREQIKLMDAEDSGTAGVEPERAEAGAQIDGSNSEAPEACATDPFGLDSLIKADPEAPER
jgi:hypothetical protein